MSAQRQSTAVLSWDTPRDTGGNRIDAQRNIRYGWLSALESKDGNAAQSHPASARLDRSDMAKYVRATYSQIRHVDCSTKTTLGGGSSTATTASGGLPAIPVTTTSGGFSVIPSSKDPADRQNVPVSTQLPSDLIASTRPIVAYIFLSLAHIDAQLDDIMMSKDYAMESKQLAKATNCSLGISRIRQQWQQIAWQYWGLEEDLSQILPGRATIANTCVALTELVQVLLVEGALLFGRAEFGATDIVRKAVEACIAMQRQSIQLEQSVL